ncbi:MAG: LLM class flavin-dependent oxidoreductase [Actinobacteria bacterium]|nr:LLM class flavin-dependent oxidoreductase [Actinomycetota bacterium]
MLMHATDVDGGRTRFGLYVRSQHPRHEDRSASWEELLRTVDLAVNYGFQSILVGEHYIAPGADCFPPLLLLARLSASTGEMTLGTSVALSNFRHPIELASAGAFLDLLTKGNFVLGVGTGFRREEYAAFGVDFDTRLPRLVEGTRLLRRLWSEDAVSSTGGHFVVKDAICSVKPYRASGPPIWMGATSPKGVRVAAELCDAWIIDPLSGDLVVGQLQAIYREELRKLEKPPPQEIPRVVDVFVAPSRELALERSFAVLAQKRGASMRARGAEVSGERAVEGAILGSPQTVIEGLQHQIDSFGITHFSVRMSGPGIDPKHLRESVFLFGTEVLPGFRDRS